MYRKSDHLLHGMKFIPTWRDLKDLKRLFSKELKTVVLGKEADRIY